MDDQQEALNGSGEETAPIAPPAVEEQTGEEPTEPEVEAEPTGDADTEEVVETEPKKGANARIQELNAKKKAAEAKADTLAKKLEQLETARLGFGQNQFNAPSIQPGQEVTPEQYEQSVQQKAMNAAYLVVQQNEAINKIQQGLKEALSENPELKPGSDAFDPDLSDSISEDVELFIRSNPRGDVKKFIEKKMKPYRKAQEVSTGEATREIVKQSAERATRPTALSGGEKPFESLSLAEMEAKLGKVY